MVVAFFVLGAVYFANTTDAENGFLGIVDLPTLLFIMLMYVLVGITEGLMFRGILLNGLLSRLPVGTAVVASGVIFGVFHFINLLAGRSFAQTMSQVVNVVFSGILMGALYVTMTSILAVIICHTLWDLSLDLLSLTAGAHSSPTADIARSSTANRMARCWRSTSCAISPTSSQR